MDRKEVVDRLQYMLQRCDEDGMCRYYAFKTGCAGCCEAVRIAVDLLEHEEVPQPRWAEKVMERFMRVR